MDTDIKSKRGGWGSNFGFLMASIGSAVGLGNIWGFPYKMGKSGGAVFLLFYLVLVVLVGVTVMLGELALGRRSGKSGVSTYRALSKKYTWLGYAGVLCGFCIMCFYFVLGGIVLRYTVGYFLSLFGGSTFAWSGQGTDFFGYFLTDTKSMILFFVLYILLNIIVVSGGVHGGIEKFCNIGMPALFCLLVFIIVYIACQPGAAEGYKFSLYPALKSTGCCTRTFWFGRAGRLGHTARTPRPASWTGLYPTGTVIAAHNSSQAAQRRGHALCSLSDGRNSTPDFSARCCARCRVVACSSADSCRS